MLIIDNLCEETYNSEAFVDIATAARHRGLNTFYMKHNLFHRSQHGSDVEFQNTHIDLFKYPRDVMLISTLSAQLGLGSQLVYWYPDAIFAPYNHLLIDVSPQTDDRLRYCTSNGSIPLKFFVLDLLKQSQFLVDEHTKYIYSPSVPVIFPQLKKSFRPSCPERFERFHCDCVVKLLEETWKT